MTLVQLQYLVAVDTWRHFGTAARQCHVTQPTLSMQLRKLEEELGIRLFDRSRSPIVPTAEGEALIAQARVILSEAERFYALASRRKGALEGDLKLGIIPTLAPYLLPLILEPLLARHPGLRIRVTELTTDAIVEQLKRHVLDAGLLATPLGDSGLVEDPLFYEEFVAYVAPGEPAYRKRWIAADDLDARRLWLLEDGHCLRSQIMRLCELHWRAREQAAPGERFQYEAGSVETLKKLVETRGGATILPELAARDLSPRQRQWVRRFGPPQPVREISLVVHRPDLKKPFLDALRAAILQAIPARMRQPQRRDVIAL